MNVIADQCPAQKQWNLCCCCLKKDCTKDVSAEYFHSGQKEVYEDMLKDTFDFQICRNTFPANKQFFICDECITQVRTSALFKMMILQSEETLQQYSNCFVSNEHKASLDVNLDSDVKIESQANEKEQEDPEEDISFDNDDILPYIKVEDSRSSTDEGRYKQTQVKRRKSQEKKNNMKKCKVKSEALDTHQETQKDWSKLIERRGNGPLLRENSLKLLENSTICVFQWNKSRYRCFCCKEPFSDLTRLKQHTLSHNLSEIEKKIIVQQNRLVKVEVSVILCKLCSLQVATLSDLRQHLKGHGIKFILEEDLLVPFKINEELKCQICAERFTVFRLLNIHMNKHFQKQVCHICGTGFSNLVFLNLHKTRSHRPLKCKHCDLVFLSKSDQRAHNLKVHGLKMERKLRFPCPYCSERFFQENFRVEHLVLKHGMVKPEHKCNICSKVFITKSLCNNHVKNVHMKEKCHECDICHNLFYTRSDVVRHRVTHTGEKKFACGICNSPFATKDSLRRHTKRTHVDIN